MKLSKKHLILATIVFLLISTVTGYYAIDSIRETKAVQGRESNPAIIHPVSKFINSHLMKIYRAILRMQMNGTAIENIRFTKPDELKHTQPDDLKYEIFAPEGGNVEYQVRPKRNFMEPLTAFRYSAGNSRWYFSGELAFAGIGTEEKSDITAFLVGISKKLCTQINDHFLGTNQKTPRLTKDLSAYYKKEMVAENGQSYELPVNNNEVFSLPSLPKDTMQACFQSYSGEEYVFFHILKER